jgi:hypothetical protein
MTSYTVIKNAQNTILSIRRDDGASIPVCEGNRDYQQYLEDSKTTTYPIEVIPDPIIEPIGPSIQDQIDAILELI